MISMFDKRKSILKKFKKNLEKLYDYFEKNEIENLNFFWNRNEINNLKKIDECLLDYLINLCRNNFGSIALYKLTNTLKLLHDEIVKAKKFLAVKDISSDEILGENAKLLLLEKALKGVLISNQKSRRKSISLLFCAGSAALSSCSLLNPLPSLNTFISKVAKNDLENKPILKLFHSMSQNKELELFKLDIFLKNGNWRYVGEDCPTVIIIGDMHATVYNVPEAREIVRLEYGDNLALAVKQFKIIAGHDITGKVTTWDEYFNMSEQLEGGWVEERQIIILNSEYKVKLFGLEGYSCIQKGKDQEMNMDNLKHLDATFFTTESPVIARKVNDLERKRIALGKQEDSTTTENMEKEEKIKEEIEKLEGHGRTIFAVQETLNQMNKHNVKITGLRFGFAHIPGLIEEFVKQTKNNGGINIYVAR